MQTDFHGTFTVMVTPTNPDGSIAKQPLRDLTEWQVEQGIHGLVALGSTGEFLSLSRSQRTEVLETVIDVAGGQVPVLAGTGAEDTRLAMEQSREAEKIGADGVMVIPPFYSTPSDDELAHYYECIAGEIAIPVMIYNNPATANVDIRPQLAARLSRIEGCDYIKESTLDVSRVTEITELCEGRMKVFGGILGLDSFIAGAVGWVAVASNVAPAALSRMFTLFEEGRIEEARELDRLWRSVIEAVGENRYVSATKAMLNHMGANVGQPLPPRLPLSDQEDARMLRIVESMNLRETYDDGTRTFETNAVS